MTLIGQATAWANRGICPIPLRYKTKVPLVRWTDLRDRQVIPHPAVLRMWFENGFGQTNLGIILSRGLVVVDFDVLAGYRLWVASHSDAARTYSVQTGRGVHAYFWVDDPPDHTASFVYGDVKATGIVVVPPSKHPCGSVYAALDDTATIQRTAHLSEVGIDVIEPEPVELAGGSVWTGDGVSIVDRIKARLGITEMLSRVGVRGWYQDRGKLMCCCPFHDDRHPSMQVWMDEGRCYCFVPSCAGHRKLDSIGVYALRFGLSMQAAIAELAQEVGE